VTAKIEDPRRFLDPEAIARISRLDLRAKQVVDGFIAGMHRSQFFGHSVEFVQHREYTPGDDIRHLDWKVWSKTDRFYVKQYEEETNLGCTLAVDVSESMHYGRGGNDKYSHACTAAACLAYLILLQQDSVGLITFDDDVRKVVPVRSQQAHVDAIVQGLHVSRPQAKTDLQKVMRRIAETVSARAMVIIISDLLADRESLFKGLEMLRHRRHDVLLLHVMHNDELEFPFAGTTKFDGMEGLPSIVCDPRALRQGYLEALGQFLQQVRHGCARQGIDYALIRTGDRLESVLALYLHQRQSRKSTNRARMHA
jgi:uncharacterized protein (DUF58 family)